MTYLSPWLQAFIPLLLPALVIYLLIRSKNRAYEQEQRDKAFVAKLKKKPWTN